MVRILLVSLGSEWHNDVWNVLASVRAYRKSICSIFLQLKEEQ